ncbi:MAG: hypothetical protein Q8Q01_05420 [archaeon]|nr:hypothetical protein [archaeon]
MTKSLTDIIKDAPAIAVPFVALGAGALFYAFDNILGNDSTGLDYCVAASSGLIGAFLPRKSQKIASLVTIATTLSPELIGFYTSQEPTGGEAIIAAKGFLFGMSYALTKVYLGIMAVSSRK